MCFLFILLISSCSKKENIPSNLIDETKMTNILIQLQLVEAKSNLLYSLPDSSQAMYKHLELSLLKSNKITKADFDSSYSYYCKNPAILEKIYSKVVDSLSLREGLSNIN